MKFIIKYCDQHGYVQKYTILDDKKLFLEMSVKHRASEYSLKTARKICIRWSKEWGHLDFIKIEKVK